jgi:hypothetical protein
MILTLHYSPSSCYFLSLRYRYSPLTSSVYARLEDHDIINLCSSLRVRDEVSHSYKINGKIAVLYNLKKKKFEDIFQAILLLPRQRCADNIRTVLRETGWEGMGWMHLAQDKDQ